jgi:hypothetical protein
MAKTPSLEVSPSHRSLTARFALVGQAVRLLGLFSMRTNPKLTSLCEKASADRSC